MRVIQARCNLSFIGKWNVKDRRDQLPVSVFMRRRLYARQLCCGVRPPPFD